MTARRLIARHGWTVGVFVLSIVGFGHVQQQFFPLSERPELFLQLRLPEGTAFNVTEKTVKKAEELLKGDKDINTYTAYVGQGSPRFWLGLNPQLPDESFAEIVIVAKDVEARERIKARIEKAVDDGALTEALVRDPEVVTAYVNRGYMLNDPDAEVSLAVSELNAGALPMSNGLTRLQSRFLAEPNKLEEILGDKKRFDTEEAEERGLITFAPDDLDWEDELRIAIEERTSLSPDALTGMEANLRFPGAETTETKVFGRLSAWQNWIFIRPNATGENGALRLFGKGSKPKFDRERV